MQLSVYGYTFNLFKQMQSILSFRLERLCVKDTVVKGLSFEKGMTLMMPIGHIHRDPEIWEDPENFIPERLVIFCNHSCLYLRVFNTHL